MPPLTKLGVSSFALLLMAGACGAPSDLEHRGVPVPPVPSRIHTPSPPFPPGFTPAPPSSPSVSPSATASPFPESTAVPCGTRTTASQVIGLVKRETAIEPRKAIMGPLCSGSWQFTVLEVPENDPVQVVTKDSLDLVVVGTAVCSVDVRVQAPAGIRALACQP